MPPETGCVPAWFVCYLAILEIPRTMKSPAMKYVAIAIVTVGLLYLAFRGQDLGAAMDAMGHARIVPLLGGLLIMFLSHAVRALRWRIVLWPLKRPTSLWLAFKATIAGYAMNNLIPRSGELVRPYMMARGESIPMAGTLASVVVERLADVLALAGLIVFSLVSFQSRVTNVFPMFNGSVLWGLAVLLILLISLILVFFSASAARNKWLRSSRDPCHKNGAIRSSKWAAIFRMASEDWKDPQSFLSS